MKSRILPVESIEPGKPTRPLLKGGDVALDMIGLCGR